MKVISKDELFKGLVDHPYDTNPDLVARVNFFFFSDDNKLALAYYESPKGWFDVTVEGFSEIDYVLEGEVELESETETLTARAGDCFLIEDGDQFRWKINEFSRMIFFIYPITEDIRQLIDSFYQRT
jgi:ethanolamine utilization protein EutQ (cupin superfamily)